MSTHFISFYLLFVIFPKAIYRFILRPKMLRVSFHQSILLRRLKKKRYNFVQELIINLIALIIITNILLIDKYLKRVHN